MNFEDEEYVRVYKRKTRTVKRIGWQGRTVLWHMLIEADSAGAIEIGDDDEVEVIADLTELPEEVVRAGLAALASRGVTERHGSCLLIVRHVEAQNARRSDRLRAKEYRARKTAEAKQASRSVMEHHESSRLSLSVSLSDQNIHIPFLEPTEEHREIGKQRGIDVATEFARFQAHARAKGRAMADPSQAFTLWLLDEAKKERQRVGRPSSVRRATAEPDQNAINSAIEGTTSGAYGAAAQQAAAALSGKELAEHALRSESAWRERVRAIPKAARLEAVR